MVRRSAGAAGLDPVVCSFMRYACRLVRIPFCTRYTYKFLRMSRVVSKSPILSLMFRQLDAVKTYGGGWVPRKWFERSGAVLGWFRSRTLRIHRGKRWRRLQVHRWNVGFTWANFARTSALAVFKKKATSRKQKKRQLDAKADLRMSLRVQQIKDVRSGVRRRSALRYDDPVALAIQATAAV